MTVIIIIIILMMIIIIIIILCVSSKHVKRCKIWFCDPWLLQGKIPYIGF